MCNMNKTALIFFTIFVLAILFAAALMAFLLGLVFPVSYSRCNCSQVERKNPSTEMTREPEQRIRRTVNKPVLECIYKPRFARQKPAFPKGHPDISAYPFLVSLSLPTYIDAPAARYYACNGIVIDKNLILTGEDCIDNPSDFLDLRVRSESNYWSKLGKEHSVMNYFKCPYNSLLLLKIEPDFLFSESFFPVIIPNNSENVVFTTVGWKKIHFEVKLKKFDTFRIIPWQTNKCRNCTEALLTQRLAKCRDKPTGEPLIADKNQLIGMLLGYQCEGHKGPLFYNVLNRNFQEWLRWIQAGKRGHEPVSDKYYQGADIKLWSMLSEVNQVYLVMEPDYNWILDITNKRKSTTIREEKSTASYKTTNTPRVTAKRPMSDFIVQPEKVYPRNLNPSGGGEEKKNIRLTSNFFRVVNESAESTTAQHWLWH